MHNKNKVIFNKKLLYEYNICLYVLEELCDKGIIDVFEMTEAVILLRKKYRRPVSESVFSTNIQTKHLAQTRAGVVAIPKRWIQSLETEKQKKTVIIVAMFIDIEVVCIATHHIMIAIL